MRLTTRLRNRVSSAARDTGYFLLSLTLILLVGGMSACGGGGSSTSSAPAPGGSTPAPQTGQVLFSITDAPGDFLVYTVTLDAITLNRANGDVVETLPASTEIDFTELTEVSELLTVATVPTGTYETITMHLDFSTAEIIVEAEDGSDLPVTPLDSSGAALSTLDVTLELTSTDAVRVTSGTLRAYSLDFDLDASNSVDLTNATVTVEPVLLATPELETDREHRIGGLIADVDTTDATIDINVRPFRHRQGQFGEITINVTNDTSYEIDGIAFSGAEGLNAVASLPEQSPIQASGMINAGALTATTIYAGSSVPWSDADVLRGVVTARSGETLTLGGVRVDFADGRSAYRGEFTMELDAATSVTGPRRDDYTTDSVSVGQPIRAWGEFSDDNTLLASRVQMRWASLTAAVLSTEPLVADLYYLSRRNPDNMDFTGTGISVDDDADPEAYDIDTGALGLNTVAAGDLLRARGLIAAFGTAPADFNAVTILDVQTDSRAATLKVGWSEGTAVPFNSIDPAALQVDLSAARSQLKVRGVPRDFIDLMETVTLAAPAEGNGVYAVRVRGSGSVKLIRAFADLITELNAQLDAGNVLHRISAQGSYNTSQEALTTRRASFVFSSPTEES